MAQLSRVLMAGLLFHVESKASDVADRSALQGFLSKYMLAGSDAPSSMSDYDKFITPNLNRVKHGSGAEALSSHKNPVELGPNMGVSPFTIVDDKTKDFIPPTIAERKEKQAVQKLLTNDSSNPITLSAIGIGLLSLVTMLGVRLQRGLQPVTVFASSGGVGPVMPMNTASALGDNVMEMKTEDPNIRHSAAVLETSPTHKVNSSRVGWGQLSSQNLHPLTVSNAVSWQKQLDRIFLDIDMKPRTRARTFSKVIERREEILTDVRTAVEAVQEKGFKDGHGEAINLLFPKGTIARSDLEGLQALRKQVPEAIEDLRKTRPTTSASPPSPPKPEDLRKAVESLRDGSLQSSVKEELKNALRSTPKGLETPKYTVEKTFGECEVRKYEAYSVAELSEKRPDGDAFNLLAAYLFGKNSESKSMSMTMPVEMVDGVMSFVLPEADASSPPAPTDDAVSIAERPARRVVALPFPGVATPEEIERQRSNLADALAVEGLGASDDSYTVLQYNSPFTIPWRRRNELVVALSEDDAPAGGVQRAAAPAMPRASQSRTAFVTGSSSDVPPPPPSNPSGSYLESL
jgi:hypothetical protein